MINRAILLGRLGKDPEVRFTTDGKMVTTFSIATDEQWKDKDGKKQEKTEWHNITTFDKLAEICAKYLTKGKQVYIEGKIVTRKWEDKQGQTRYSTGITANTMKMLGGGSDQRDTREGHEASDGMGNDSFHDDVPF